MMKRFKVNNRLPLATFCLLSPFAATDSSAQDAYANARAVQPKVSDARKLNGPESTHCGSD